MVFGDTSCKMSKDKFPTLLLHPYNCLLRDGARKKQTAMKTKRIYQEPEMKVVNIDPTVMICVSPGTGGGMSGGTEAVKEETFDLDGIW